MATINYDFYCGEDKYSDGSVEDHLRYLTENQIDIITLDPSEITYPVVYHLSHLRENIINWYPIGRDQSVLEIGAGCGAITGALCRKAGRVVSVDLSKRRAEINFQRNRHADNLTVYVGNQNDIRFEEKFDYVILNGVFEYAMSFTEGSDPYRTFLETTRGFLKENGKLLIAIENRLGLKYFTGSAEDHTGNYFLGLNQYPGNRTVRTFSKTEWMKLLDSCGLKYKFYYPYPDYKFPVEIFTDKTLVNNEYGKGYFNLEENRYGWLREQALAKTFVEEGVIGAFTNSFFLEICPEESFANIDYCKLSCDRKEDTRIITVIAHDGDQAWVEKQAANEKSAAHVEQIYRNSTAVLTENIRNLPGRYEPGKVSFPFITDGTLSDRLQTLLAKGEADAAEAEIRFFFDQYFGALPEAAFVPGTDFKAVFGPMEIPEALSGVQGSNIDLIFENLYCSYTGYQIIDPEWVFSFIIPKAFVIWRAVHDFYEKHPAMESKLRQNALLAHLGVDPAHADVFVQWNAHFVYQWLKGNSLEAFAKPVCEASMDHMVSLLRAKTMLSCCLYYDCGEGYAESRKLVAEVPLRSGDFEVSFDLSRLENLKALRFDPVEGSAIRCSVRSEQATLTAMNAWTEEDGFDVFMTDDPMYQVSLPEQGKSRLKIAGKLFVMPDGEKFARHMDCVQKKDMQIQQYKESYEASVRNCEALTQVQDLLQNTLQQTQSTLQQTQSTLQQSQDTLQQTQSTCQQTQDMLQQTQSAYQQTQDMLQQTQSAYQQTQEKNAELYAALELAQARYDQKEAQLQSIFQTKGWRMLEFARKILRKIKRIFSR